VRSSVPGEARQRDVRFEKRVAAVGDRQRGMARSLSSESRLRGVSTIASGERRHSQWHITRTCGWRERDCDAIRYRLCERVMEHRSSIGPITDDDLLRFFTVSETAGMLG
jgi:hypothetical protein